MAITEVVQLIVKINRDAVKGIKEFGHGLSFTTDEMKSNLSITKGQERAGTRLGVSFKKLFTGLKGFRMEMLSVMFFGMGMQRLFGGLLQPAMQLTGVFDIFRQALAILFLPAAMLLQKWAISFLNWVLKLSPETKSLINKIALLGFAFGTFLATVGTLWLGLGGILTAFGGLIGGIISLGIAILGLLANPLGLLIAAIIGLPLLFSAVTTSFNVFGSIGNTALNGLNGLFQKVLNIFPDLRLALEDAGIHTQSLGEAWADIWDKWIQPALENIKEKIKPYWEAFKDKLIEIWDKLKTDFPTKLEETFKAWLPTFVSWGIAFGKALVKGLISGLGKWAKSIGEKFAEEDQADIASGKLPGSPIARSLGGPGYGLAKDWFGMASGGIVTRPTPALVGESGPEAVIPLDKAGMFGGVNISIVVNAAINSSVDLNNLARRIGAETASSLERNFRR